MTVEIIATYFRDEFFVPLFMQHYDWADKVTLITRRSGDGKLDDEDLANWKNECAAKSGADWIVVLDMDEFIFPLQPLSPIDALSFEKGDCIISRMHNVYRHIDDKDVNPLNPPLNQRRHGTAPEHHKCCIFRNGKGIKVGIGCHFFILPKGVSFGAEWSGVHWSLAEPSFCVQRRTRDRKQRLSERNIHTNRGYHVMVPDDELNALIKSHANDPIVIQ
jgi:hypothetical protein